MLKLTQLLHSKIVNDNAQLGTLGGLMLDKRSGKCLFVTDNAVYAADTITYLRDEIRLTNAAKTEPCATVCINQSVYDLNGKFVGQVSEVELGKTAKFAKITVENGSTYTKGKIGAIGDIVIVKLPSQKKPRERSSVKQQRPNNNNAVTANPADSPRKPYPNKRRYGDFSFLIGKTTDKNIKNFYGEIMIKRGEKITVDILRQAKLSGKLVELCLHAK